MILLVTPNSKKRCYSTTKEFTAVHPNIDAAILHSYLVNIKEKKCSMIHMEADNYSEEDVISLVDREAIEEVWVICTGSNPSCSTMTMPASIQLASRLKAGTNAKVVMYGGHPSSLPELTKIQSGCDEVIVGDGIDCDAKDIPIIDWEAINPWKYRAHNWHCFGDINNRTPYASVWTTLGCPYRCKFCAVANMYKNKPFSLRQRNIEDVVDEVILLNKIFGVRNIRIMDELFTYDMDRVDRFSWLLMKKNITGLNMWFYSRIDTIDLTMLTNMKAVGANWVAYGFESPDQDTLDLMGKKTKTEDFEHAIQSARSANVNIIADVIAGFPDDNYPRLERLYKFLEDNLFEMINLYPLFHLPGTELYEETTTDWSKYQLYGKDCIPASTKHLSSAEVLRWRDMAFNRYMTSPKYLNMIEKKFGYDTKEHIVRMMDRDIRV